MHPRLLVAIAVAGFCVPPALAVVICPASWAAGQEYTCMVSGGGGNAPAEQQVELISPQSGEAVVTAIPASSSPGLYKLAVPAGLAPGAYEVRATALGGSDPSVAAVQVTAPAALLLLEHDKAMYKPGQTALFRALALQPRGLTPLSGQAVTFAVKSPQGFKLLATEGLTDIHGVVGFEFPVADEPLLGLHSAHVSLVDEAGPGSSHEVMFAVEEYVLPRFEVNLTLDQSHLTAAGWGRGSSDSGSAVVTGRISATYTFGMGVDGMALVTAYRKLGPWERDDSSGAGGEAHVAMASVGAVTVDADGGGSFELSLPRDALRAGSDLVLEASVVDGVTLERQNATAQLAVIYEGESIHVDVSTQDGAEVFKPGLPLALRVQVQLPGGRALSDEQLASSGQLSLVAQQELVSWKYDMPAPVQVKLAPSDFAAGVALVEVFVPIDNSTCCRPLEHAASQEEHERMMGCCSATVWLHVERDGERLWDTGEGMTVNLCLSRAYSPTGHYLAVTPPVDSSGSVLVRSTLDPALLGSTADYAVFQGALLAGGGSRALAVDGASWQANGYWEASMVVDVPQDIMGACRLLIIARQADGFAIVASAAFSRAVSFPFTLAASFSASEVKPGEQVTIGIQSSSNVSAHAFITSLDRSAELLGARAAVDLPAVASGLERMGTASTPLSVAARAWRECWLYGSDVPIMVEVGEDFAVLRPANATNSTNSTPPEWILDGLPWGKPLRENCPRPISGGCSGGGGGAVLMAEMAPPNMDDMEMSRTASEPDSSGSATGTTVAVRKFFPETWLWTEVAVNTTGDNGFSQSMAVIAPDTITTWSLEVFATTPFGMSAVRSDTPLRVFKPFFVEVRLPYSAIRGEELEVIIVVFNYIEGSGIIEADLTTSLPSELALTEGSLTQTLQVPEGSATRASIRIRASSIGTFRFTSTATTATSSGQADAIERALLVRPEGFAVRETRNAVLDLSTSTQNVSELLDFELPSAAVDGSARATVAVVGDMLGPTISGLDKLLRIPTGCGEQNMITLAPNVYVGRYLVAMQRLRPELRQRITRNLLVGYGRELTYRHPDGSFSAFGEQDEEGSTWLTAFVLRTFAEIQALGLVAVDASVLLRAAQWLVQQQAEDGSFKSIGRVIHNEMMGGLGAGGSGESASALTSFVSAAVAKAKAVAPTQLAGAGLEEALRKAGAFLQGDGVPDRVYGSLLRVHALLLMGLWGADKAKEEVLRLASKASLPGRLFWTAASGSTLDVELTGYGVLALTLAGSLGEAFQGSRWLLEQRSASGGFHSTQDTVVALGALATYAEAATSAVDVSISLTADGGFAESVSVQESNSDVMQMFSLPTAGADINIEATGNGMALVVAELSYNLPMQPVVPCYEIDVHWFSSAGSAADLGGSVQGCGQRRPDCEGAQIDGMWIMEIGLFTGYSASSESLRRQRESGFLKRFELGDGKVDMYLEGLAANGSTCVEFNVTREFNVFGLQPAASELYEYYAPERRGSAAVEFLMETSAENYTEQPVPTPAPGRMPKPSPPSETASVASSRRGCSLQILAGLAWLAFLSLLSPSKL